MKKTTTILATLALGVVSATAGVEPVSSGKGVAPPPPPMDPCAGPISYNNVELLYANTDYDGSSSDSADGGILRIEYSPMTNLYFTASGQYTDFDSGNIWTLTAGIGGYVPLTENIHVAGDAGLVYSDWEYDYIYSPVRGTQTTRSYSDSDTGWYVRPHLRAKWGCLTVHAGALYTDISESEDWSYFINGYYQIAQSWDITAGYADGGDSDSQTFTAGVRYRY